MIYKYLRFKNFDHQGVKIAALEEIAFLNGWIDKEALKSSGEALQKTGYGQYLLEVAAGKIRY
ncbi:hypothetical protein ACW7EJ_07315 [Acinetobacter soli]